MTDQTLMSIVKTLSETYRQREGEATDDMHRSYYLGCIDAISTVRRLVSMDDLKCNKCEITGDMNE